MSDGRSADITPPEQAVANERPIRGLSRHPTVDDMSEWSFPASDPPATWTWDPPATPKTGTET
jgi:hypothetical protein